MTRTSQQERKLIGLEMCTVVITTHTTLRAAAVAAVADILDSQCIQYTSAEPSSVVFLCCSHFVNALAVLMVPAVLGAGIRMRTTLLCTLLVVLAVAACVSATSPPRCDVVNCSEVTCEPVDCTCGSYKGSCGCCDFCYKCPGDVCTPLFQERCSDGHTCELDKPGTINFGGKGKCKPSSSS